MSRHRSPVLPGDGIGPEITEATLRVLTAVADRYGIGLDLVEVEAGDRCFEKRGVALPEDTVEAIRSSDACLKGPVGETAFDVVVRLRMMFDLYANVRPIKAYPNVPALRPDIDFVFVRENTEDVYKGLEHMIDDNTAVCLRVITRRGCERIARFAFELARQRGRRKLVTAIHKANVMRVTCGLFASVCREVAKEYSDVELQELYVDAAAMHLIKRPHEFDVLVTTNMFGDILSDEAAQLIGGLGMAPGANIGDNFGLFEPIHGSAPKYAGKGVANPCAMILAAKMMLEWLGAKRRDERCREAAREVDEVVAKACGEGVMTPDLGGSYRTHEVGEYIASKIVGR